jgi:hypothetical protein
MTARLCPPAKPAGYHASTMVIVDPEGRSSQ